MTLKYKIQRVRWWFNAKIAAFGLWLVRSTERKSNYLKHLEREWSVVFPESDEMQDLMKRCIVDLTAVFASQGYSGFSAGYATGLLQKVLRFEPLSPLTGAEDEWADPYLGDGTQQNKRCSRVFRDADGRAYDIEGRVFVEASGAAYTNRDSRVYVTFPYTPTTERVSV